MAERPNKNLSNWELNLLRGSARKRVDHGKWLYEGDPLNFFGQRSLGLRDKTEGIIELDRVEQAEADKQKGG